MTMLEITTILALELETEDTEAGSMLSVAELLRNKLLISMVAFVLRVKNLLNFMPKRKKNRKDRKENTNATLRFLVFQEE